MHRIAKYDAHAPAGPTHSERGDSRGRSGWGRGPPGPSRTHTHSGVDRARRSLTGRTVHSH
eukprot:5265804-Prymnesium_polylepis.1